MSASIDLQGTFSDRLIAWGSIDIAARYDGVPAEQWLHLSGKQGQDKEGVILLRLQFQEVYVHSQVAYGQVRGAETPAAACLAGAGAGQVRSTSIVMLT